MNHLNSEFFRNLEGRAISENFFFSQKASFDPFKDAILKKFHLFIRNKLSFFVVSQGTELLQKKRSSDSAALYHANLIQSLEGPAFYFPLILEEAMLNNSMVGCAIVTEKKILVFFEKFFEQEKTQVDIKVSLVQVYRFLKTAIGDNQIDNWALLMKSENRSVHLNLYETLRNPMSFRFSQPKFVCELEIVPKSKIKAENIVVKKNETSVSRPDYRFIAIKIFLTRFKKDPQAAQNLLLAKFTKMLAALGVRSLAFVQSLFQLHQVSGSKKNYDIFMLMFTHLSANFQEYGPRLQVKAEDVQTHLEAAKLRPIGVITPEYGEFVKVGGLAVMIEDLCNGLAAEGETITVVMPYYDKDKSGQGNYLQAKGASYSHNITVSSRFINYEIGVHRLSRGPITFYFLHNAWVFPSIYQTVP
jgi:hypothetical protein